MRGTVSAHLAIQRRDQSRSGVELDVGLRADRSAQQERDAAGRFSKTLQPASLTAVVVETRQQRRNAARLAAKRGVA